MYILLWTRLKGKNCPGGAKIECTNRARIEDEDLHAGDVLQHAVDVIAHRWD